MRGLRRDGGGAVSGVVLVVPKSEAFDGDVDTYMVVTGDRSFYATTKEGKFYAQTSNREADLRFGPAFDTLAEAEALAFEAANALADGRGGVFGKRVEKPTVLRSPPQEAE